MGLFSRLAATEDGADAGSEWKGYRVILVDASLPEASILARLSSAGFDKVLSESTEPVLVSDWSGLKTISLAEAEKRMLPGDPRLDFYIQRLSQWFQAREGGLVCRVLYLKTGSNTDAPVDQALAEFKGRYFLPGSGGRSPSWIKAMTFAIAVVLMFGSCAATSLIRRGSSTVGRLILEMPGTLALDRLAFRLTIALPWVLFASRGAFSSAIATLWCLACTEAGDSLELPLEEIRHGRGARKVFKSLSLQGWPPIVIFIVACVALLAFPSFLVPVAFSLLASLLSISGYALVTSSRDPAVASFHCRLAKRGLLLAVNRRSRSARPRMRVARSGRLWRA